MSSTEIRWQTVTQFRKTFDDAELAEHLDEDGEVDTWTIDSVLADLEGGDDAYDGTTEREITRVSPVSPPASPPAGRAEED